jgi:hypothetical protein
VAVGSIAVYTALFGGYDRLLEQPPFDGVDFICFTDDAATESRTWAIRPLPAAAEPRRAARAVKTSPHLHLPDHEWAIWVDARLSIRSDAFVDRLLAAAEPTGFAAMAHHQRRDVYEEAAHVYRMGFDTSPALLAQVARYRAGGLPEGSGLYSTMAVARRSHDPAVRHLDERWREEIEAGSVRDQVALPFVVWETGLRPGVLDLDPYQNELYVLHHHLEARRYPPRWRQRLAAARFRRATGAPARAAGSGNPA